MQGVKGCAGGNLTLTSFHYMGFAEETIYEFLFGEMTWWMVEKYVF